LKTLFYLLTILIVKNNCTFALIILTNNMDDLEKVIEDLISKRKSISEKVNDKINKNKGSIFSLDTKSLHISTDDKKVIDNKNIIISHLKAAKISHKKWMSYVQILIRLGNVNEAKSSIPINYTMCDFGKWYYGDGQILHGFPEYLQMEEIHKNVHDTYLQIYELYVKPIKGSLFNSEKSQLAKRDKEAQTLSVILEEYSKIMFDLLNSVENSVKKTSNNELLSLM